MAIVYLFAGKLIMSVPSSTPFHNSRWAIFNPLFSTSIARTLLIVTIGVATNESQAARFRSTKFEVKECVSKH